MVKLGVAVQLRFQNTLAETGETEGCFSEGMGKFELHRAMQKKKPRTNLAVVVCILSSMSSL